MSEQLEAEPFDHMGPGITAEGEPELEVGDVLPADKLPGHIGTWVPTGRKKDGVIQWRLEGIPEDDR